MSSAFDDSDFVDTDFKATGAQAQAYKPGMAPGTPISGADLATHVNEADHRLAALRQEQEKLQRQRDEMKAITRKKEEFDTGRDEMQEHLTRGLGLLEKAEFDARSDAEQMAKTLNSLREAMSTLEAIDESNWREDELNTELTQALTSIENARMEWNSALLKWPLLQKKNAAAATEEAGSIEGSTLSALTEPQTFNQLCRLGFALTWPVMAAILVVGILIIFLK